MVSIAAYVSAILLAGVAVFQLLLSLGFPLAEYSWGGKYKGILPAKLRLSSLLSFFILLFMASFCLSYSSLAFFTLPSAASSIIMRVLSAFLALNTLGNLASRSNKERLVMTPLSGIAFLACLTLAIIG